MRCDTGSIGSPAAACEGYMRTIRLVSLVRPAMAAHALGGLDGIKGVLKGHPRVGRNARGQLCFMPVKPT